MLLQESIYSEDDIDLDGNAMLTEKPKYSFDDLLEQVQVLLLAFHHAVQPFCYLYCNAGPRLPCPANVCDSQSQEPADCKVTSVAAQPSRAALSSLTCSIATLCLRLPVHLLFVHLTLVHFLLLAS